MEILDARPYVLKISDNLHLIPADDNLGIFPRRAFSRYYQKDANGNVMFDEDGDIIIGPEAGTILKRTLESVKDHYDLIFIDTPPMLSEFTANALIASTGTVVIYQTHEFCFSAVRRFLETIRDCQEGPNPDLKLYGILSTMLDKRRSDANAYLELINEKYSDLVLKTTIKHKASIARLPIYGLDPDNKELDNALDLYKLVADELLGRIKNNQFFEITEEMTARDE
jgi:chromosome partitioning protein